MNRLKELREDRDLRQIDVAKAIGITQRNYSYFETGQTMLTEDVLRRLAKFYETSIDYLLYRTDIKTAYPLSMLEEPINQNAKNLKENYIHI